MLTVMGEQLHKVVDVTIHYPQQIPTFWQFLSGKVRNVYMNVNVMDITPDLIGDYASDKEYKKQYYCRSIHAVQSLSNIATLSDT